MIEDFYAINLEDFRKKYLDESYVILERSKVPLVIGGRKKKLDTSYEPKLGGKLAQAATKLNLKNAEQLNRWATAIHNRVASYVYRIRRKNPHIDIKLRVLPMEDWRTQSAAIIIINIKRYPKDDDTGEWESEIEATIFDDNNILIRLGDPIADIINKGNHRKALRDRSKAADYLISAVEAIL
jgi:hypothetical protein